ncbi:hypothetical protein BU26DRAFT_512926 [Trematosphaeria pertusa]|uniref:Uncharacterized protein n=1 Tax=Trematosphaeria pertusa TaxID=390896 RepID=A0A6A6J0I1_9PLEO|nr:uncharacterized protein BU26DRAFT_512926 [Trematosphaeria pertusa]KAF2256008.1 hypothetical protein BU26DRAFT_512926 [Trematosphaeria pertusa]
MKLLSLLLLLGVTLAIPLDSPSDAPPPLDPDTAIDAARGCGTIWKLGDQISYGLQGDAGCHTLPVVATNYMVGKGCACIAYNAPTCNFLDQGQVNDFMTGPAQGRLKTPSKYYACREWPASTSDTLEAKSLPDSAPAAAASDVLEAKPLNESSPSVEASTAGSEGRGCGSIWVDGDVLGYPMQGDAFCHTLEIHCNKWEVAPGCLCVAYNSKNCNDNSVTYFQWGPVQAKLRVPTKYYACFG